MGSGIGHGPHYRVKSVQRRTDDHKVFYGNTKLHSHLVSYIDLLSLNCFEQCILDMHVSLCTNGKSSDVPLLQS